MDLLTREHVAQALGLVGFFVSLAGYTSASDRRLKAMMTVGLVFLTVHFMVFGAWLVALNLTLNTGRTWLSLHRRGFRWFIGIAAVQLAVSLPLMGAVRDVFPVAGSIMGTYALYCLSGVQLRVALLVTTGLWFVNNLLWGSIGAMLLDFMNALANLVAIRRIRAAERGAEVEGS